MTQIISYKIKNQALKSTYTFSAHVKLRRYTPSVKTLSHCIYVQHAYTFLFFDITTIFVLYLSNGNVGMAWIKQNNLIFNSTLCFLYSKWTRLSNNKPHLVDHSMVKLRMIWTTPMSALSTLFDFACPWLVMSALAVCMINLVNG